VNFAKLLEAIPIIQIYTEFIGENLENQLIRIWIVRVKVVINER